MTDARLRTAIVAVALVGVGVAGYLTYVHYAGIEVLCVAGGGGCERVQASRWAELAGVPVALLGLVAYLVLLGAVLAPRGEAGRLVALAVALGGTAFSAYLTYVEIWRVKAICQWCVGSAVLMLALAGLTAARWLRA